jgi:hypothetical protein
MLADGEAAAGVVEKSFCGFRIGIVETDTVFSNGNPGVVRQRFAIDDHEFGAEVQNVPYLEAGSRGPKEESGDGNTAPLADSPGSQGAKLAVRTVDSKQAE